MIKIEINYDKLLDDWAEEIYKIMDQALTEKDNFEFGTPRYYSKVGFINGISVSIAKLNQLERKIKKLNYK